jgi:tetratricopeptide (TPR) repeat protein
VLSDDLTRWFDDELWRRAVGCSSDRFTSAIHPRDLLVDAPAAIWPALMPCDFLPILGNDRGDWLCIRFGEDDSAGEVVHWYHGGGDWIPWGNSLAEAIYFDHLRRRLPGGRRDHAVSAVLDDEAEDDCGRSLRRWAGERLKSRSSDQMESLSGSELAQAMLANGISEVAVLCQLVIDALDNPLLNEDLIRSWPIRDADQIQRFLFDNRFIPARRLSDASEHLSVDQILAHQDWDGVESYCRRVTEIRPELAWGWDLLGYAYERRGDIAAAQMHYQRGLDCSIFTDQTVRLRTHGFDGDGQKFSAIRLKELGHQPDDPNAREYFRRLCTTSAEERRELVREHFSQLAEGADAAIAHHLWNRAGWDLGAEPMFAFAELLDQITLAAEAAGRSAQSELAKTHRACFRDRYGI